MIAAIKGQRVLAVDPSLSATGVALVIPYGMTHVLSAASLVKGGKTTDMLADRCRGVVHGIMLSLVGVADVVVIERPRINVATHGSKADPDDLIKLAILCGAIAHAFSERGTTVMFVKPDAWKGQAPKDITTARAVARLSDAEMARVQLPSAASLQHNVWDAVGIGLWAVGRW